MDSTHESKFASLVQGAIKSGAGKIGRPGNGGGRSMLLGRFDLVLDRLSQDFQ